MKLLLIAALLFSIPTFAREPKATLFADLAESTVKTMFAQEGDTVNLSLTQLDHDDSVVSETWIVSLSNGPSVGSRAYEITIKQNTEYKLNQEAASVKVKLISSN